MASRSSLRFAWPAGIRWRPRLALLSVLTVVGACAAPTALVLQADIRGHSAALQPGRSTPRRIEVQGTAGAGGSPVSVCVPPAQIGDATNQYADLRMAPYRACRAVSDGRISGDAYRAFLEDYPTLVLLAAANRSLDRLRSDPAIADHRARLEALAGDNAALELICAHPNRLAGGSERFELCAAGGG